MRYRLRTLLILLGVLPPALAALWLYPAALLMCLLLVAVASSLLEYSTLRLNRR
jgi:hypothetical protein